MASTSIAFSFFGASTLVGTENDMVMTRSAGSPSAPALSWDRALDTQRYMVGGGANASAVSSSSPSPAASGPGLSSAVESAFRFPRARDCFLSRRLIVSACTPHFSDSDAVHVVEDSPSHPPASSQ